MNPINTFIIANEQNIVNEVPVHKQLALSVLKHNAQMIRPFVVWSILRTIDKEGKGWFNFQEVLKTISDNSYCNERSVRIWIQNGLGVFFNLSNGRLWLISRDNVFEHFEISYKDNPKLLIPVELLINKSIKRVRANLFACWNSKKTPTMIARSTLETITEVKRRTQIAYDNMLGTWKKFNYFYDQEGEKKNLSNTYSPKHARPKMLKHNKHGFVKPPELKTDICSSPDEDNKYLLLIGGKFAQRYHNSVDKARRIAMSKEFEGRVFGLISPNLYQMFEVHRLAHN